MKTKQKANGMDDWNGLDLSGARRDRSSLRIEVVPRKQIRCFDELLKKHHYLEEAKSVGDFLRQVAIEDDKWVALMRDTT